MTKPMTTRLFPVLVAALMLTTSGVLAQTPAPVVLLPERSGEPAPVGEPAVAPISAEADPMAAAPAAAATVVPDAATQAVAVEPAAAGPAPAATIAEALAIDQTGATFAEKRRLGAVTAFYADRANAPVWIVGQQLTAAGRAVIGRIARAAEDGLDPSSFALSDPDGTIAPETAAGLDVGLSLAVLAFAELAYGGQVSPASISGKDITRKPPVLDQDAALRAVASAADPAAVLDGFNPPHQGFAKLKAKLAEVRTRPAGVVPVLTIAAGPSLKPGMADPRLPDLRTRLDIAAPDDPATDEIYDDRTLQAVKAFQAAHGLVDDGILGARTLAVLNGESRDEEGDILANMEMWRWMPREFGADHVFVNVPEFMVRVVRHGVEVHEARVVVGTPTNKTPVFSDEMEYLVVNPYWHVPESIKTKEMLPEIKADPAGYFSRHGYEVVWDGQVIDPSRVVWDENAVRAVGIRQVPGEANALGNIKFMFPNQHAVYLHDTPSRKLFQRGYRAFSHGCVRVDDPMSFAGAILEGDPEWTVEKLKDLFGGPERRVNLAHRLQVHIGYFNAFVDDAGVLQLRDDLYGHTAKIKTALGRAAG